MPGDISFVWPASGIRQVIPVPGGGCNIKFTFAERCIVRSSGKGHILKVRSIPTKRIAQQYEIVIRHEDDFESSYSIVDQTPNLSGRAACQPSAQGTLVERGSELYNIRDGGVLHFQLFRAGKLVDPREYIRSEP